MPLPRVCGSRVLPATTWSTRAFNSQRSCGNRMLKLRSDTLSRQLQCWNWGSGLLEGYSTKVNYYDLCLTIAECCSFSVGTKSDGRKAVEWLEKCWDHKAGSTSFSA
ncbi:hypothetical protein BC830DRAFT_1148106 [Chytriomyces sp. MP71]|nr:hypothetical protein BC830DRAFT_1148106 [Chytriomyces sp. MP71]